MQNSNFNIPRLHWAKDKAVKTQLRRCQELICTTVCEKTQAETEPLGVR